MDEPNRQETDVQYSTPFHNELFHFRNEKIENKDNVKMPAADDKALIPEQLNTDKPQANHVVAEHLQKVAEHFEKYFNRLHKVVTMLDKHASKSSDNQNNQKCPFMRVANAVGFKYAATNSADADDSLKRNPC